LYENLESRDSEQIHKRAIDRADRRLSRQEKDNRFLVKRSEDYSVFDDVFDAPTLMVLNGMINNGVIKSMKSAFASGKEAKIYSAIDNDGKYLAVKIYLTVSSEFKKRLQYLAGDPRFTGIRNGSRNLITMWAKKEYKNLYIAHKSGVRVPFPHEVRKNVIVMEFIGDTDGNACPNLVNSDNLTYQDYKDIVDQMSTLYQKAELVHADLSEFNIFKNDNGIVLFDFGSAVDKRHPYSNQFLVRDISNVNNFFEKRGFETMEVDKAIEKIKGVSQ